MERTTMNSTEYEALADDIDGYTPWDGPDFLPQAAAALRKAAKLAEATTWLPMDSAPKDGTLILLLCGWPFALPAVWNEASATWVVAMPQTNMVDGEWNDPYWESEREPAENAKGWMPLPPAPQENPNE